MSAIEFLSYSKISQFDQSHFGHKYILNFDVSMDDVILMQVLDSQHQLGKVDENLLIFQSWLGCLEIFHLLEQIS